MKGISLWQPWASAMAVGSKHNETRHWPTNHRGPTAIHAAQRLNKGELLEYGSFATWIGALRPLGAAFGNTPLWEILPFGAIVAVGNLIECVPTNRMTLDELDAKRYPTLADEKSDMYGWTERDMGNYELGRYAWIFDDLKPLTEPIPFKGMQGFFNVPDELLTGKY